MTRLAHLALLLALSCAAACSPPAGTDMTPNHNYQGASFKRTALMVADMDRALTLYRDVLGLTVDQITTSNKDSFGYATL